MESQAIKLPQAPKKTVGQRIQKHIARNWQYYLLCLPALLYVFIFCYGPMYGIQIAFRDYKVKDGISGSEWVGLDWFIRFFQLPNCWNLIKNTIGISVYQLVAGFPLPIILALLINQCPGVKFKKVVQTVTYAPHFISVVVVVGMLEAMLDTSDGVVNNLIRANGGSPINFFGDPRYFRPLYVGSGIWQSFGWNSIIYLAALTNADPALYEAARIDGANRWQQTVHISIPCILPTMIILLIMQLGNTMSVGYEKIILMYEPSTYEVADVISTYVYRRGIEGGQFSFATAVGLFNSVINLVLLISVNALSRRLSEVSLW